MKFINTIYKRLKQKQPYRVIGKSIRNVFFPEKVDFEERQRTLFIEISSICNAKCIFCIYRFNYRSPRLLEVEEFRKIAESAVQSGYHSLNLCPLTGEIFIHPDAVPLIRLAKKAGFEHISATTNGILLYRHNLQELLQSGINQLVISFPGFTETSFAEIFGVRKFPEFIKSVSELLITHQKLDSKVMLCFAPRSYLTREQIMSSDFYKNIVSKFESNLIYLDNTIDIVDSWGGKIKSKDLVKGMKVDRSPIKSLYPLKKVYLCDRLLDVGVLANGDVRLCICRYDSTIETPMDPLFIDKLNNYSSFQELMIKNKEKINQIWADFITGNLPKICRKCPFYRPIKDVKFY